MLEGVAALRERYGPDVVAVLSALLEPQSEQRLSVRDAHAQFAKLLEAVPGTYVLCARAVLCCAVLRPAWCCRRAWCCYSLGCCGISFALAAVSLGMGGFTLLLT